MTDAVEQSLRRETVFDLDTADGKKIWCVVNHAADTPSQRAIIFSHGLTSNPNEYLPMAARDYFTARGFDMYRFAYYWAGPDYRQLRDCTLTIHAADLNCVLAHVRSLHDKAYICGHSYGGMTMLFANPVADAISFWDSAFHPWTDFWQEDKVDVPELGLHSLEWGSVHLIGTAMVDEARHLSREQAAAMAASLTAPAQIVTGEKSWLPSSRPIFDHHPGPKDFREIAGASHSFQDGIVNQRLFAATEKWFNSYS